jgi:hypothetical protein
MTVGPNGRIARAGHVAPFNVPATTPSSHHGVANPALSARAGPDNAQFPPIRQVIVILARLGDMAAEH